MIEWKFNPSNYKAEGYQLIPAGKYRVRIENAEEKTSSTGKPMIKLTLKVNGYNSKVWHYVVFDSTSEEAKARTDDRLGRIFDSFEIEQGNLNLEDWKGKSGGALIKNEPDNKGVMRAVVSYFLKQGDQILLPMWEDQPAAKVNDEMLNPEEEIVPF